MVKPYRNEVWKKLEENDYDVNKSDVRISNYGRVKRKSKGKKQFVLSKLSNVHNFYTSTYYRVDGRCKKFYVHKMVAKYFIGNDDPNKKFVIHKDHDLQNNHVSNLQYVNQKELTKHQRSNPKFIEAMKKKHWTNSKLTETRVKLLKRKLNDPNRKTRLKMIAKQFGISEMQLHRIKTGENWGYVTEY